MEYFHRHGIGRYHRYLIETQEASPSTDRDTGTEQGGRVRPGGVKCGAGQGWLRIEGRRKTASYEAFKNSLGHRQSVGVREMNRIHEVDGVAGNGVPIADRNDILLFGHLSDHIIVSGKRFNASGPYSR